MKTITSIPGYCREVNIEQPKYNFFDIRRFEEKVTTENAKQEPFRHEFYAIALRHSGYNKLVNGTLLEVNLFFNSPYQVVSWDVLPDWKGWYIMFGQEFLALDPQWKHFLVDFPFFKLDKAIPFNLPSQDAALANTMFQKIFDEYHADHNDKFNLIQAYTSLLLLTKRYYNLQNFSDETSSINRSADILLLSRFQTMIETNITGVASSIQTRKPSFYAGGLNVHPNHLNAVVKRITGKTTTDLIHKKLVQVAKLLLTDGGLSAKEVTFSLDFKKPAHFTAFFKKATGFTPQQYRQIKVL